MTAKWVWIAVILFWFPGVHHLRSQSNDSGEQPTVILGTVAGDRGTTVGIPLYLRAGNSGLRRLSLTVDFISSSVKFDKSDKGPAAESPDFELKVLAESLPPEGSGLPRTRLKIELSPAGTGSPAKPLPDGLWSFLNFTLSPEAKPFAVSLNPVVAVAQGNSGQPVKMSAEAGKVIVSVPDEPLAGCFFFTH